VSSQPDPWEFRASDSEREAFVEVLQVAYAEGRLSHEEYDERMAQAYEARTFAELAPLVADLPNAHDLPAPPGLAQPSSQVVARGSSVPVTTQASAVVAVFSSSSRKGRWAVDPDQSAVAVFGSVEVDLRQAELLSDDTEIRAVAVFGEVKVVVPSDVAVDVNGVGVLGEFERKSSRRRTADRGTGVPVIRVTGAAILGSVSIVVKAPDVDGGWTLRAPGVLPQPPQPPKAIEPGDDES